MRKSAIFIVALFAAWTSNAQSPVPDQDRIWQTAQAQIQGFIKDIPDQDLADYGFSSRNEFGRILFGAPIPFYQLRDSAVVFTDTWRVPLVIDGEYRSLLTVVKESGVFRAVDFGAAELARAWAATKTPKTVGILRVYEIRTDYLIEESGQGKQMFMPLKFNQ